MTDRDHRWKAVADAINDRMNELAMTQADLAAASGISDVTIRQLQRHERSSYRGTTLAKVALALGWTADSIDRILRGAVISNASRREAIAAASSAQPGLPPDVAAWAAGLDEEGQRMLRLLVQHIANISAAMATDVVDRLDLVPPRRLALAAKSGNPEAVSGVAKAAKSTRKTARPKPPAED